MRPFFESSQRDKTTGYFGYNEPRNYVITLLNVTGNILKRVYVATQIRCYVMKSSATSSEEGVCSDEFRCEYNVMRKLVQLESMISSLVEELRDAQDTIEKLNKTVVTNDASADGTTYIRWGRTTCPSTAFLVYEGYTAGSHYTHPGTAVNPLCLPKDPIYDKHQEGFQSAGRVYGAEYQTNTYSNKKWNGLNDHDIPCAVCRIPRNDVLMVPARNVCHENYMMEYKGYLMSSYYNHAASYEFICVDDQPETGVGGRANLNGQLFYFVEAECGSLPCPAYENGWELTCAVCSFSPNVHSTHIQPYT